MVFVVFCNRNFKTACKAVCHSQAIAFSETVLNSSSLKKKKKCECAKRGFDHLDIHEIAAQHYYIFGIKV